MTSIAPLWEKTLNTGLMARELFTFVTLRELCGVLFARRPLPPSVGCPAAPAGHNDRFEVSRVQLYATRGYLPKSDRPEEKKERGDRKEFGHAVCSEGSPEKGWGHCEKIPPFPPPRRSSPLLVSGLKCICRILLLCCCCCC